MGNYITTKMELKNYLIARVPLVIIDSSERERVERMLRELSKELSVEIEYYTDTRQVEFFGRESRKVDVDSDFIQFVTDEFKKKRGVIFAVGDVRKIGEDCLYTRELLGALYLALESDSTIVLITPDSVWQRIVQFGMLVQLGFPDASERVGQINDFIRRYSSRYTINLKFSDVEVAATLLRGFSEIQIENILSYTLVTNGELGKKQLSQLTKQKGRLYSNVSVIEEVNIPSDLCVSGLENLKLWLRNRKTIFFSTDELLASRGLKAPKGILLVGVSGCGKSLSAKMVAREWQLPLYRFDIGTVYDKWVGESERKMKQALQYINNVTPCIVWVDEIEKVLSVVDNNNDVGRRVLGQFLFWLQESSDRVFLVATANDVRLLPPELFRKGRFSQTFFVDLPNKGERKEAILQYSKQSLRWEPTESELLEFVEQTKDFTYADIEYSVKSLAQKVLLYGEGVIGKQNLVKEFTSIIPFATAYPEQVEEIRVWGSKRAISASNNIVGE